MNTPTSKELLDQTSIANRAMLFKLSRGGTRRRVRDKDAEAAVKQQFGDEGQIVSRELFQDKNSLIYKYQQLSSEMYGFHNKATLPFGNSGERLLPNHAYFDYTTKMQGYISQLDQMKNRIVPSWDSMVQQDIAVRNARLINSGKAATAKVEDYPTVDQIEASLYVDWTPRPISTSGDFRFEIPQDMIDRFDQQLADMVDAAGRDLYVRMLKPVTAFIEKLSKYRGDDGQRFSGSFIENLNALSSELPKLNLNNDPEVDRLLGEIDKIITPYKFSTDALKEDPLIRADVKSRLEQLEGVLKGYAL